MKTSLANDMRPTTLNEVIGQSHLKELLEKIVQQREMISFLLYGVPGIGKTSLAYALCNDLKVTYSYFNAATGNKKELVELIKFNDYIIIDEIHRLNKDKQDILLPALEFAKVKIIATTTENPFFVVNPAVRSRMHILELKELSTKEIIDGLKMILKRMNSKMNISQMLLKEIALSSNGDFRNALNIISLLEKLYPLKRITRKIIQTVAPSVHFYIDKKGDGHYDLLSAFHKSLRGSNVDASLYYLAQLITSGDLIGMERRLLMVAYEDVGMADPNAALRVVAGVETAKKVGFPEARIPLAIIVVDLCLSAKSNSAYMAISKAIEQVNTKVYPMPDHLKDNHYASAQKLGRGVGYKYPHDYGGHVEQEYMPDDLIKTKFYKKNKNDKR